MFRRQLVLTVFIAALAAIAVAQFPIPGQGGPRGRGGQKEKKKDKEPEAKRPGAVTTNTFGILRRVSSNQLVIETDDHRVIWYTLGNPMTVRKESKNAELASFTLGDYLNVGSSEDDRGMYTANSVLWQKAATPADQEAAKKTWDLPRQSSASPEKSAAKSAASATSPPHEADDDRPVIRRSNPAPAAQDDAKQNTAQQDAPVQVAAAEPAEPEDNRPATQLRPPDAKPDEDDPGAPVLRRGKPAPKPDPPPAKPEVIAAVSKPTSSPAPIAVAATPKSTEAPAPPTQEDQTILKARRATFSYAESLPNYMVQQLTTRYENESKTDWRALDIVSADVTYQDGTESYKNVKIGNKAVNKPIEEMGGAYSTGEFATMLQEVLAPGSPATFRRRGADTIRSRDAIAYTFEIARENARWRVETPSELYYPAIKGTIWIDKQTFRVLRIEQQAVKMPALFPFDTTEASADYDFMRLGTAGPFLLPVEAEVLSCQRGTSHCSKNTIEFRNYRKFAADSVVVFDDKQ